MGVRLRYGSATRCMTQLHDAAFRISLYGSESDGVCTCCSCLYHQLLDLLDGCAWRQSIPELRTQPHAKRYRTNPSASPSCAWPRSMLLLATHASARINYSQVRFGAYPSPEQQPSMTTHGLLRNRSLTTRQSRWRVRRQPSMNDHHGRLSHNIRSHSTAPHPTYEPIEKALFAA